MYWVEYSYPVDDTPARQLILTTSDYLVRSLIVVYVYFLLFHCREVTHLTPDTSIVSFSCMYHRNLTLASSSVFDGQRVAMPVHA